MSEGFTSAVANVFNSVLKVPTESSFTKTASVPGTSSGKRSITDGSCPAPTIPAVADVSDVSNISSAQHLNSHISPSTPAPFLKQIIKNEKETVESLMRAAAKIGPVVNTVMNKEAAADAAFISKVPAPIPTYGSTLQGFTFILLFCSFISLAIVTAIYINMTTGNVASAAGSFIGILVMGVLTFALMKRFA